MLYTKFLLALTKFVISVKNNNYFCEIVCLRNFAWIPLVTDTSCCPHITSQIVVLEPKAGGGAL